MNLYCLGLEWLGYCKYDPSSPPNLYLTLGDAVAALAFTIAVNNFLRPIYRFRLSTRYLSLSRLYLLIFLAVGASAVGALVPWLPIAHGGPWGYAIVWEIIATILFVIAYGAVAVAVIWPVTVSKDRVDDFARAAATLLSAANEDDHKDLVPDLQASLPRLVAMTNQFSGEPLSEFSRFTYRKRIDQASYAHSLLRILADPQFCRTLVTKVPWATATIINSPSEARVHSRPAELFIQEISKQAIDNEDSMLSREIDYHGFATAPELSNSLYSDPFIVQKFNPIGSNFWGDINRRTLERFNAAFVKCILTTIDEGNGQRSDVARSGEEFYRSAFLGVWRVQTQEDYDFRHAMAVGDALASSAKLANRLMAAKSEVGYEHLYREPDDGHRPFDDLGSLVEIIFQGLCSISNKFNGIDDPFWMTAIDVMRATFPDIGDQPDGMTPFQQRLAIEIIDKVHDNMRGLYPSLTKVLLARIGPYEKAIQQNSTAAVLLRKAFYWELQDLPKLADEQPSKINDYLPPNVKYDRATNTLTHTYSGGSTATTNLSELSISPVDLFDKRLRRSLSEREKEAAVYDFDDRPIRTKRSWELERSVRLPYRPPTQG